METIDRIESLLLEQGVPRRQIRKQLAKTCGISVQAVGEWFNGKTKNISNANLAAIAKKYGTTIDHLLTGSTPIFGDNVHIKPIERPHIPDLEEDNLVYIDKSEHEMPPLFSLSNEPDTPPASVDMLVRKIVELYKSGALADDSVNTLYELLDVIKRDVTNKK